VTVSEQRLNWLNAVRAVGFLAALALMGWAVPFRLFARRGAQPQVG
jgi:hypothetical protein